jgi:hypothetical protein
MNLREILSDEALIANPPKWTDFDAFVPLFCDDEMWKCVKEDWWLDLIRMETPDCSMQLIPLKDYRPELLIHPWGNTPEKRKRGRPPMSEEVRVIHTPVYRAALLTEALEIAIKKMYPKKPVRFVRKRACRLVALLLKTHGDLGGITAKKIERHLERSRGNKRRIPLLR